MHLCVLLSFQPHVLSVSFVSTNKLLHPEAKTLEDPQSCARCICIHFERCWFGLTWCAVIKDCFNQGSSPSSRALKIVAELAKRASSAFLRAAAAPHWQTGGTLRSRPFSALLWTSHPRCSFHERSTLESKGDPALVLSCTPTVSLWLTPPHMTLQAKPEPLGL